MTRRRGGLMLAMPSLLSLLLLSAVGVSAQREPRPPLGGLGVERMRPVDPSQFVRTIDNPYLPLAPGARFRYVGTGGDERENVVVGVLDRTRRVLGVETVVVRETVHRGGSVVEQTMGWYAQDRAGNVWHFGEDVRNFEEGRTGAAESWQAGVNGARAGIIMKGRPEVGDTYRQEYYSGEEEDVAQVLSLDQRAKVPYGELDRLLVAKDFTPIEPDVVEHVFYARGIGVVLEVTVQGGQEKLELVNVSW